MHASVNLTSALVPPQSPVRVLLVQSHPDLGELWRRYIARQGASVLLCRQAESALQALEDMTFDVVVLDLLLVDGNGLTVADVAAFRQPRASVLCVTDNSFFSDGSIFSHCATARLTLNRALPPEELAEIVAHYGRQSAKHLR